MPSAALVAVLGAALLAQPSGRPPRGALERTDPRIHDVTYEVVLNTAVPYGQDDPRNPLPYGTGGRPGAIRYPGPNRLVRRGGVFDVADSPIVMPLIMQSTWSRLEPKSIRAELWLADRRDMTLADRFRIDDGGPHHTHFAVLPIVRFQGQTVRWSVSFRATVFRSKIDDAQAAAVPWPREWPKEVADGLGPQMFIESEDPVFLATIERITGGRLRLVPPYLAAKDIVRYCVNEIQLTGPDVQRGRLGTLHGLWVQGAAATARTGIGNRNDLVCLCVAMLRAAGIPARPVIGITKDREQDVERRRPLLTWAEFYLPETGWIPFDPGAMRGKGIRQRDVGIAWPEFGTMRELNRRIPLAYHFVLPMAVETPQNPAAWGWDPRPNGAPSCEQRITIKLTSRGPAPPEER